ncbi:MAG: DUF6452 family protein [Bacteroidota bacterium]
MTGLKKNNIAAIIIAVLLEIASCTPEACFEETVAKVKVPFYLSSTQKVKAPDNLTIYGLNKGTDKIYAGSKSVSRAEIPLNPSTDSCGFVLIINGVSDTIMVVYDSYPHLISVECGYTYYHTISRPPSYTKNIIDNIIITNKFVTTGDEENFRILY